MRTTNTITIDLIRGDCFTAVSKIKKMEGIAGVSVVTCKRIRVKYKQSKIAPNAFLELINGKIVSE